MTEIVIETVEQLRNAGYSVTVCCTKCGYNGPALDLNYYIRQGRGHMRPIDLRLKHARCKTLLQLTVHAAKGVTVSSWPPACRKDPASLSGWLP